MKNVKKNTTNHQAPPHATQRRTTSVAGMSENHPAEDPRLRSYHRTENQARFTAAQQYSYPGNNANYTVQRKPWGPDATYDTNDMDQLNNDLPLEDEARTLNRIRTERSRMLDDE